MNGDTEPYFATLFAQRPLGSLIAVSSAARGFRADFYDEPAAAAAACAGAIDVYARVTPLRERPPIRNGTRGRGDASLVAALLALWVELDVRGTPDGRGGVKAEGFDSIEHAIEVARSVLEPTLLIGSGGGVHPYVVLADALVITTPEDLARAEALVQRYQQAVRRAAGGIPIDSTHDLARVLRPPGTFNGKGPEPRPVKAAANGHVEPVALQEAESELPPLDDATSAGRRARARRQVVVDEGLVRSTLQERPGLATLSQRSGPDPSADDHALACAAAREGIEPEVVEQLVADRLLRHGDPKGKAARTDYVPRTVETAFAAVARARRDEQLGDPLAEASAIIGMEEIPIVAAEEQRGGRVVLERADERALHAPSLEALAKYDRLVAALGAGFGHELAVGKGKGASTAVRFAAALRRHFGPGRVRALEERVEGWMADLVALAEEIQFSSGNAEDRLRAWKELDELDPAGGGTSARSFAEKVKLAHDTSTGDRYLRSSWAQEYVRRCGWRGGVDAVVGLLEAIGLEQPNRDGRVRARWRAGDETVVLRFWVIPRQRYEEWRS